MRYLSPEWFDRLDRRLRSTDIALDRPLRIEHRVTGTPDGEVTYHLCVDEEGARLEHGAPAPADVRFRADYETARAIAEGAASAQAAFLTGDLAVGGDLQRLMDHADVFRSIDGASTSDGPRDP